MIGRDLKLDNNLGRRRESSAGLTLQVKLMDRELPADTIELTVMLCYERGFIGYDLRREVDALMPSSTYISGQAFNLATWRPLKLRRSEQPIQDQ